MQWERSQLILAAPEGEAGWLRGESFIENQSPQNWFLYVCPSSLSPPLDLARLYHAFCNEHAWFSTQREMKSLDWASLNVCLRAHPSSSKLCRFRSKLRIKHHRKRDFGSFCWTSRWLELSSTDQRSWKNSLDYAPQVTMQWFLPLLSRSIHVDIRYSEVMDLKSTRKSNTAEYSVYRVDRSLWLLMRVVTPGLRCSMVSKGA